MAKLGRSLLAVGSALLAASSPAREICWIDHVARSESGIEVYFSAPTSVQAIVGPKEHSAAGRYFVRNAVVTREQAESDRLTLTAGATVYLSQLPEDVCTLEVVDGPDRWGVVAKASNRLLGGAPATATSFISAR